MRKARSGEARLRWAGLGLLMLLAAGPALAGPAGEVARLELGAPSDLGTVITTQEGVVTVAAQGPSTVCLGVVEDPGVEDCLVVYSAQLASQDLKGLAYLEMWCQMPDGKSYFSRGLDKALSGPAQWTQTRAVFILQPGQRPERLSLHLVVAGQGRVSLRQAAVSRQPRP